MTWSKKRIAAATAVAALAAAPAIASADPGAPAVHSAADAVYGPGILGDQPGGTESVDVVSPPAAQSNSNNVTSLPFTGYAAGTVLLLGLAMALVGVLLRRKTRAN
jgi:hypothetical protein